MSTKNNNRHFWCYFRHLNFLNRFLTLGTDFDHDRLTTQIDGFFLQIWLVMTWCLPVRVTNSITPHFSFSAQITCSCHIPILSLEMKLTLQVYHGTRIIARSFLRNLFIPPSPFDYDYRIQQFSAQVLQLFYLFPFRTILYKLSFALRL